MRDETLGEVIESSTTRFAAVCREVFEPPRFGSFVKVSARDATVYGVVTRVETASFDSQRRPVAFGMGWEELAREQPQLIELLQTVFETAVVGFADEAGVHHYLPPYPPRLHEPAQACAPREVTALTGSLEFIRTLAGLESATVHEVVAAAIREASRAHDGNGFVGGAARAVADLFKDDYDRATAILRRIE